MLSLDGSSSMESRTSQVALRAQTIMSHSGLSGFALTSTLDYFLSFSSVPFVLLCLLCVPFLQRFLCGTGSFAFFASLFSCVVVAFQNPALAPFTSQSCVTFRAVEYARFLPTEAISAEEIANLWQTHRRYTMHNTGQGVSV